MSASQIPLWVTLALALVAPLGTLAGALGGQWVAARSTRARERERVENERGSRWEERRFDVLAVYVVIAEEMVDALCHASFLVAEKQTLDQKIFSEMSRIEEESREKLAKLRLSLPPHLHYECLTFHRFFHDTSFTIKSRRNPVIEDSHMPGNAFEQRLERLVRRMQQELGIDDPEWW
ncbi:hypothetical protein ILP97_43315 [Amycolatopsis sp. H6(2020)]|nr:hypothetical protein [Amycolatopsis sp. H6(2020)]